jgi:hypothetical protein
MTNRLERARYADTAGARPRLEDPSEARPGGKSEAGRGRCSPSHTVSPKTLWVSEILVWSKNFGEQELPMSKREFRSYVRATLKIATTSKDQRKRLEAVRLLASMVLAQEYAKATG